MTKEELEKEADEYLEDKHCKNVCTYNEIDECKQGIRIRCMSFNYRKNLMKILYLQEVFIDKMRLSYTKN